MKINGLPPWAKSTRTWLTAATVVFGFYAGAAAIGLEVPRWTWISEHQALAGQVKKNKVQLYQGKVESLERRHTSAIIAKADADPGSRLYNVLLTKEVELRRQLESAKAALKKVRGF